MGYFLAVSAFKIDPPATEQAITDYCTKHGVPCRPAKTHEQNEETDAAMYHALNGWTRVLWPAYFNSHDFPLCTAVAASLRIKVSTVHVYDGDYWEHLFLDADQAVHNFSSWPDYLAETPHEAAKQKEEWRGDVSRLGAALEVPEQEIARYVVHLPTHAPPPRSESPNPARGGWLRALFGRTENAPPITAPRKVSWLGVQVEFLGLIL